MKKTTASNKIAIPIELLPAELRTATPEHLAHLITIGHKVITIKGEFNKESKAATVIGQIGEDTVRKIYEKRFAIENVSKQGRTGDVLIRRILADPTRPNRQAILVEIKNYSTPVGISEVEKFYRDLSANSAIGGGIFISLNTKIVGIGSDLYFTQRGDMPIVFLSLDWASEGIADELINLTADIIWAHLDARFVVDKEIFQKLSSKLTKLNDCINGLSMARTYITETRQMIDKQLTKIYETSYETEVSIRAIINSIGTTLARGSADFSEEENVACTYDSCIDHFTSLVENNFPNSLYSTDIDHQDLVNVAVTTFLDTYGSKKSRITLANSKKGVHITVELPTKNLLKIMCNFLKSRTDIQYWPNKDSVSCPNWASCTDGLITFPLDSNSTKREILTDMTKTITLNM